MHGDISKSFGSPSSTGNGGEFSLVQNSPIFCSHPILSGRIQGIIPQNEHIFWTTFLRCIQLFTDCSVENSVPHILQLYLEIFRKLHGIFSLISEVKVGSREEEQCAILQYIMLRNLLSNINLTMPTFA
jgi:hypothetical protein